MGITPFSTFFTLNTHLLAESLCNQLQPNPVADAETPSNFIFVSRAFF